MGGAEDATAYPESTPHLNPFKLQIRSTPNAGRGLFATEAIAAGTLVEVSPALVFPADEYEQHGRHTQLDSYTFVWRKRDKGRNDMTLALGLGSLFNHDPVRPNVSYSLDREHMCIRYTTVRQINPGEELCISYGAGKMWWEKDELDSANGHARRASDASLPPTEESELRLMSQLQPDDEEEDALEDAPSKQFAAPSHTASLLARNEGCPLWRVTAAPDPMSIPLTLADAWVLSVPSKASGAAIVFARLHTSALGRRSQEDGWLATRHLKVVANRTVDGTPHTLVLLCLRRPGAEREDVLHALREQQLPFVHDAEAQLHAVPVPTAAAPCKERLAEWTAHWPVSIRGSSGGALTDEETGLKMISRAADRRAWSPERVAWVRRSFARCIRTALDAKQRGEVGVGAFVSDDYGAKPGADAAGASSSWQIEVAAHDTRCTDRNPLKHAVVNAIRAVADLRQERSAAAAAAASTSEGAPPPSQAAAPTANGQDYLLTSLVLFTTHEPCVYCSMALVHSRVRAVYFLLPSPRSGGCCGAALGKAAERSAASASPSIAAGAVADAASTDAQASAPAPTTKLRPCDGCEDGGPYALQEQPGLNHHYEVWRWIGDASELLPDGEASLDALRLDCGIDP